MLEKINKYCNLGQIIGNIAMLIMLIVLFFNNSNQIYALYWMFFGVTFIGNIVFIMRWGKSGIDVEKYESKTIFRSFDDSTTISMVFYGFCYLGIIFADSYFNLNTQQNIYIAVFYLLLTYVYQYFNFVVVDRAIKDTVKIVDKKFVDKKREA